MTRRMLRTASSATSSPDCVYDDPSWSEPNARTRTMRTLPIRLACGRETGRRRRLAATFRAREAAQAPALEPFSRCSPRVRKQIHRRALWTPHRRRRGRLSQQTLSEQSVIDRCRPGWSRRRWSGSLTPTPAGSYGMASDISGSATSCSPDASTEEEIAGPGGVLAKLTKRLVERARRSVWSAWSSGLRSDG